MPDYISREALDALLHRKQMEYSADNERPAIIAIQEVRLLLQRLPAADVVPVVHGEWIDERGYSVCSACGQAFDDNQTLSGEQWLGCPMCLARMDGGEHHAD